MGNVADWPARMEEMATFVGLSDEDRELVRASAPAVLANARQLTDAVYDRFLEYPAARMYFLTDDGEVDHKRITANKQTMIRWLRDTAAAPSNEGFARYVLAIGTMHKDLPIHRPGLPPVPSRYVVGTISFYQTAIAELLRRELPDSDQAARCSAAWNKLLIVVLDLMLASYLQDPATEPH